MRLFAPNNINVAVLSDIAKGEKGKVEKLRREEVLNAAQFFTVADFLDRDEADVEDLFGASLYADLVTKAYGLRSDLALTAEKLAEADNTTPRVVKQAEAAFRLMPPDIPEFSHYTPAEWLLRNPAFLDGEDPWILACLGRFEAIAERYNSMLP